MGILFACIAIAAWGVGDFLIQRSTRRLGDWEALFFITLFASIVLLPFIYGALATLTLYELLILSGASVVILVAALVDFEALRVGKISVIEPVYAMEVPVTIAVSAVLIGEFLSREQLFLVGALLIGVYLISNKRITFRFHRAERGVFLAAFAAIGMGTSNFLFGIGARETDPLMINWFTSAFMMVATLTYLLCMKQGRSILAHWRHNKKLILSVGASDNIAWVAYSASTLYLPIGVATGLTESYIALAAVLGITINKERLVLHQKIGLALAVGAAIFLALTVTD